MRDLPFDYDVALSFAGEDREVAAFIARHLAPDFSVFYDEFETAELWGSDLSETLPDRYVRSRFCVLFLSPEYLAKMWTVLERQAIVVEFLRRRGQDFVLPVRMRGFTGSVPGVPALIGYITIGSEDDWGNVLDLLRSKLRRLP